MRTIHKYPIPMQDEFVVEMPKGSRVLCAQVQHGQPHLWALVDTGMPPRERRFALRGTGHPAPKDDGAHPPWEYVGSFRLADGAFVGHLFVEGGRP